MRSHLVVNHRVAAHVLIPAPPRRRGQQQIALLLVRVADGKRHDLGFADHLYELEVEAGKLFPSGSRTPREMAFEATTAVDGNLVFGECRRREPWLSA